MSRVLVTGGTGYVAGWCIVQLLEAGHDVVTTVRSLARSSEVPSGDQVNIAVADLTADAGWDEAMAGCERVLHVASPLSGGGEGDDDGLVAAAVDGTTRVLRAAARAGVQRVVVTSSCAAATPPSDRLDGIVDETTWTDPDDAGLTAYRRSKVLAERAAWTVAGEVGIELATVLPAAVFGPARSTSGLGSLQLIQSLLDGSSIAIPHLGFEVVDVRDAAAAHLLAMTSPEAAGERFIVSGELLWFEDVADLLRAHLTDEEAAKVPTTRLTDDDFRSVAERSPALASLMPLLGRSLLHDSAKARRVLGWSTRPAVETVVESARCLLDAADGR